MTIYSGTDTTGANNIVRLSDIMPGVPTKVRWLFFSLNAGNGAAIGTLAHLGQSTTADILPAANLQWPLLNPNNLPECADFYDLTQIFAYITASSILSVTAGV